MPASDPDLAKAGDERPIVVIGSGDPYDVRLFSGTTRSMTLAIERRFRNVIVIRNPRKPLFALFRKIVRRATLGRIDPIIWPWLSRIAALGLARRIAPLQPRVVISIANSGVTAELAKHLPVIQISDTTFALMRDFYDSFKRLGPRAARMGEAIEQASITHSTAISVSSPWAAKSVCEHYGKPSEAVHVASWGCNFPAVEDDQLVTDPDAGSVCRLLFVGLDWQRKGGDIVLDTARIFAKRQFDFQIDLVGARPSGDVDVPQVKVHGLLRKSEPAENAKLIELFRNASLLFLPTRQDCTPMVFAEANAYSVPAVSSDVGGVGGVITSGENGLLLPGVADAEAFALAIMGLWRDWPRYLALRKTSRKAYLERLNWDAWSKQIAAMIDGLAEGGASDPDSVPN